MGGWIHDDALMFEARMCELRHSKVKDPLVFLLHVVS